MLYQKYIPSHGLQPYVMCYYIWESNGPLPEPLEVHSPPNGLGGIVFNFGEPIHALTEPGKYQWLPFSFVAGQFTKNYSLRISGKLGMIGIAFWPAGLSNLLGLPTTALKDLRIDLNLVLGQEATRLEQQILESKTNNLRIAVLETFLLNKLYNISHKVDVIDKALTAIIQHKGILSINQLSADYCLSSRQFRRRFIEKVGISPKLFSRIKRFNYISNLSSSSYASWMDMVQEGGYYDQAHFIRDFCDFSGKNPTEYINYSRTLSEQIGA